MSHMVGMKPMHANVAVSAFINASQYTQMLLLDRFSLDGCYLLNITCNACSTEIVSN